MCSPFETLDLREKPSRPVPRSHRYRLNHSRKVNPVLQKKKKTAREEDLTCFSVPEFILSFTR